MTAGYNTDNLWNHYPSEVIMPSDSTELRFTVDAQFLDALRNRLGLSKGADVAKAALTLLDWASIEAKAGKVILSSNQNGGEIHRLVMAELSSAAASK
jgi:hypothetical protein